ncbi:aromatic ring-hydroxylating dioxygenase subunit alpha [Nitrospirillum iridis]|uniref:Vanillate O-demethylase monooxygenase subunit n=1 Tax=Nitrospirillum iridis TaxID=765888 RepID=A0A7X0B486_9PROT|nr:aromatic ring-hydroxylating dioxygenase subunit alpha [Nitrospirillum iridis]MBB6255398.1 vanillate O-demethylase monooxygenase subunit [Nitrospirillum iridis]
MYPFKEGQSVVRNRWYLAGFAHEITRTPMERTILGKPVVFYRTTVGAAVAMHGICPHRYFPLAQGKLQGDSIVCGYHGFVFDADGKCSEIPSQGTGAGFCQPTYPLEERGPLCWIWMGDKDRCDTALLPPHEDFGIGVEGWHASSYNHFLMKGRYQLLIDNLMDLTHLPYLHFHIPGGEAMKKMAMREEERPASYRLVRTGKLPWNGFADLVWGAENQYEGIADWESITDFYGPELIRTNFPLFTRVPGHDVVPPALGHLHILHGITPETETTTHYFGFSIRNFRLQDEALDEFQLESDKKVRGQDVAAIEAIEPRLDRAAAFQRELLVRSDLPAVKVRKIVQSMLDAER